MSDYPEFLNGSDIPNGGMEITIQKVKRFVNQNKPDGFAGYFLEVKTPTETRTLSLNFGSVLEDMMMQQLEGATIKIFRYEKGDKAYISTKEEKLNSKSNSSNTNVQQRHDTATTTRRYGR